MSELKPCPQEAEALEIIESMLDVADMRNKGPIYADDPPRSGLCRIPEEDAAILRQYIADRRAQPANEPLTLEQLLEMDGEPVWLYDINCWAIVAVEKYGRYANIPFAVGHFHGVKFEWDILDRKLVCYRRKPEAYIGIDLASGHDSTVYCRKPEIANGK